MSYRLRTIDIWDTLIRRNCHPEAVKLATAQHIFLRFHERLAEGFGDHWRLYEQRLAIERIMAEEAQTGAHDGEYELTVVLLRCLESVLMRPLPVGLEPIAADIAERELAFEMANTWPDADIAAYLADHPAEQTLYLSDFYMSGRMLDRLLAYHGLDLLVPAGHVSCDLMRNKRSGRLFAYIHETYGVEPQNHIHIGDNPLSDVEVPQRLGIAALSFLPEEGHKARLAREALFFSRGELFAHLHKAAEKAAAQRQSTLTSEAEAMFRYGVQAAPMFIGFALFIAERAIKDRVDRLFFLTREGQFFARLFGALFSDGWHAGHRLPPSSVLAVSRLATFSASINAVSPDELNRVWSVYWQQKVSTLFSILKLSTDDFAPLLARLKLSSDEMIVRPQTDPRIRELLADPDFADAVQAQAKQDRSNLETYLRQEGIRPGERIGFVDIGWRGTIQDNLARIIPNNETFGYYLALRAPLNPQPPNTSKHAFGPDERFEDGHVFFESFGPLEMLCNSPSGSVCGYFDGEDGRIVPEHDEPEDRNGVIEEFVLPFQSGVVFAAEIWGPSLLTHAIMAKELREIALHTWKKLAAHPPDELLEGYQTIPQHDIFGFGELFNQDSPPSLKTLFLTPIHRSSRNETINYIRRTQWIAGIRKLKIGSVHKFVLLLVFWFAHRYKRLVACAAERNRKAA